MCRFPCQSLAIGIDPYLQPIQTCITSDTTYIDHEYAPVSLAYMARD